MNDQYRRQSQGSEAAPTSSSRPTLGFPLGTALLLIVVFCLSGALSCFYHWEKLRPLRRRREGDEEEDSSRLNSGSRGVPSPPAKAGVPNQHVMQEERSGSCPVIMPGDQVPTFIAWPCPCEPLSSAAPPPLPSAPQLGGMTVDAPPRETPTPSMAVACVTAPSNAPQAGVA
ncbi:unnamed protein product [Spirodela intermedia]|uniref:Uncharacterized protein n=1 Tax=Spirodela intermedia TaxID=51605 RepID=A0A7I8KP05_SPIIN|nr:unnamed protein product [Spirodela intermedia]